MRAKPPAIHRINITLPEELFELALRFGAREYIGSFSEIVRQALVLMMKGKKADAAAPQKGDGPGQGGPGPVAEG